MKKSDWGGRWRRSFARDGVVCLQDHPNFNARWRTMITQQILAARLRIAREKLGLTQEEAANAISIPRTAIVQMEAGNRKISTLELASLAELYGRTISSFFD